MKTYDKLVFVGTDNTSMSPMAEAVAQKALALEDILIESKGMVVLFPEPINPKAEAILMSHGLTMKTHMSAELTEDEFDSRTLIITINQDIRERLLRDYEKAQNVFTLAEFVGDEEEVHDPYGGDLADYGHCYDRLEQLVTELADRLVKEER